MALCLLGHKVNYFILDNQYFPFDCTMRPGFFICKYPL
nr:MAG TPA: hypothetical protein [Bacteriophage sp.]